MEVARRFSQEFAELFPRKLMLSSENDLLSFLHLAWSNFRRGTLCPAHSPHFSRYSLYVGRAESKTEKSVAARFGVSGHSRTATAGGMKCSHFEWSAVRDRSAATSHTLLEAADGECSQDGEDSVDTTITCGRMVTATNRQRAGDRPRDGGATPTITTT
jgi:hypothetical protein